MSKAGYRMKVFMAISLMVMGALAWAVYEKEALLRTGETVLLELAPADPRSLMQGDYMRLNYRIANDIRQIDPAPQKTGMGTQLMVMALLEDSSRIPRHGYAVVAVGDDGVGQFARLHDGRTPLGAREKILRFHRKYSRIQIVPNSFLFQEGHRQHYERAKYGVFKFGGSDKTVLIGLAGEDKQLIVPPKTKLKEVWEP